MLGKPLLVFILGTTVMPGKGLVTLIIDGVYKQSTILGVESRFENGALLLLRMFLNWDPVIYVWNEKMEQGI